MYIGKFCVTNKLAPIKKPALFCVKMSSPKYYFFKQIKQELNGLTSKNVHLRLKIIFSFILEELVDMNIPPTKKKLKQISQELSVPKVFRILQIVFNLKFKHFLCTEEVGKTPKRWWYKHYAHQITCHQKNLQVVFTGSFSYYFFRHTKCLVFLKIYLNTRDRVQFELQTFLCTEEVVKTHT